MEKQLSFVLKLSLEEMALRRVVVYLWNELDILDLIVKFQITTPADGNYGRVRGYFHQQVKHKGKWQETVENKVKDKVSELIIPELLKKKMMHIVIPIGSEMLSWKIWFLEADLSDSRADLEMLILKQLSWTSSGAVDYEKTAEKLVRLERLDIVKRYKIACSFCFANCIPSLWEELPEEYKTCFNDEEYFSGRVTEYEFYWFRVLKKESELPSFFIGDLFRRSALVGNIAATKYLFQKLTNEEREHYFQFTINSVPVNIVHSRETYGMRGSITGVLRYLFSLLSPEQQMEQFKSNPACLLTCFLHWPWQDLFLDMADVIWTFLEERCYRYLLIEIAKNIKSSGYYFPNVIQNLFLHCPNSITSCFVLNKPLLCPFFLEFFRAEDTETMKVILRNLDVEDKMKLVCSCYFFKIFNEFIIEDKCDMVKLCLQEASQSTEDIGRLADEYSYLISFSAIGPVELRKWKELFLSLYVSNASTPRGEKDIEQS